MNKTTRALNTLGGGAASAAAAAAAAVTATVAK